MHLSYQVCLLSRLLSSPCRCVRYASKYSGIVDYLTSCCWINCLDLYKCKLAIHGLVRVEHLYFYHIYELAQLLYQLVKCLFVAVSGYSHSRKVLLLSRTHSDAFDVKTARPEEVGDSEEHTRFVFDKGRHNVP